MFKVEGKEKTRGVPSTLLNYLLLRKEESAVKSIFHQYIHLKPRYVLTVKLSRNHSISENCSDFIHKVGCLGSACLVETDKMSRYLVHLGHHGYLINARLLPSSSPSS